MAEKKKSDAVVDAFEFEDDGRKFTCSAEAAHPGRTDGWWWFSVTPDTRNQRYAPFRTSPDDTRANVQARIVEYHDALLLRRSQPATNNHWGRRPGAAAAGTTTATDASTAAGGGATASGTTESAE